MDKRCLPELTADERWALEHPDALGIDNILADAKRRSDESDDGTSGPPEHDPLIEEIII